MSSAAQTSPQGFARDCGDVGRLIADFDWAATEIGPEAGWPPALRAATGLILRSPMPMAILWGPSGILIYNDAVAGFAGSRHPACLGSLGLQGWPELARLNRGGLLAALAGEALSLREELVSLERDGHRQDVWVDIDFSPIPDEQGRPAGALVIISETTEHVLAEWRRRAAENQLALAIDATELGTWTYDLLTGTIDWSELCSDMFGLPQGKMVDLETMIERVHPADRAALVTAYRRSLDPMLRESYGVEYRTISGVDGAVRWISARGRAVFDDQGRAVRATGTTLDITVRKNAELRQNYLIELGDRLRVLESTAEIAAASSEILGRALGAARAGYAIVHGERMLVECDWTDGRTSSLTGPRRLTTMGENCATRLQKGLHVAVADVTTAPEMADARGHFASIGVRAVMKAPLNINGELIAVFYVHNTTPRRWTEDEITLLKDIADRTWEASGRAAAAQALRDLNETLEQEVAERTAQRDRMWKLSSDVMLVARFDATIESVNPAWRAVFGWREEDMVGRNFIELTHPEDRAAIRDEMRKLAAGLPTTRFESRYRRRDGVYVWLSWRAVPDDKSIHAVGRDITAEREQTEALRTTEEALRQAQKMEVVGQLTGGIAHDFNNLLQGIVGSLDLLDKRLAQGRVGELERFISAVRISANRAVALTHRLLAFSRRQPLDPKPVAANPLVASMEELLRRTMGETIEIALALNENLWPTLCDPNQLESAILNLAINARDAMPDGGRLVLETENAKLDAAYAGRLPDILPGDYICLSVTDTGTGMPQDVVAQAFEPFFTTKPIGQGTGLGLSMIYGFAKQSGGHVKIYSEVGAGTTIKVFLPRHSGEAVADELLIVDDRVRRPADGEIVLVVEDETVVRGLVLDVLDELGYQALEAADGPSGLHILQSKQRIDLLITDIGLPGLNGRQMADAARLLRPELKILFMTGYAENAAKTSGFLEPGMTMITKPFPIETLANRIRSMIEGG